jgi:hypothetical protein
MIADLHCHFLMHLVKREQEHEHPAFADAAASSASSAPTICSRQ